MQTQPHANVPQDMHTALAALKRKQFPVIISAIFSRLIEVYFLMVVVCLFLGFMHMFPFDDVPGGSVSIIFSGFMYAVLGLVVLMIVNKQLRIKLGERNSDLLKNTWMVNGLSLAISAFILYIAWIIGTGYLNDDFGFDFFVKWTGGILSVFVLYLPYRLVKGAEERFNASYKNIVITDMLTSQPEMKYDKDAFIPQHEFESSKLFPDAEIWRYGGRDLFSSSALNFHGSYLDVSQIERKQSSGNTETKISSLFKGYLFIADFNKPFNAETFIVPDTARSVMGDFYGELINSLVKQHNAGLVKFEDPVFERNFAVYAADEVEARYILSTKLVERLVELRENFYQDMYISFTKGKIYIALQTDKELLSPNIFGRVDDEKYLHKQVTALQTLLTIPDRLDLHTKIWG